MHKLNKDIRWIQRFNNFEKAITQLTSAVELSHKRQLSALEQQGLIQAFEFTHELAWNTLKDFLENKGNKDLFGSKDVTQLAFKLGLITNGSAWMEMITNRNRTSHTYNEQTAEQISLDIINIYHNEFLELQEKLNSLKQEDNE
jgi:nucleotidyltransferase substrate binding protein (TIGR01987 family)